MPVGGHEPHVELAQVRPAGEHLDQVRRHVAPVRGVHELAPAQVLQGGLVEPARAPFAFVEISIGT